MSQPLPDRIEPNRLAARGTRLSGALRLNAMPRLRTMVLDTDGEIEVRLDFHRDGEGHNLATGRVTTRLRVTCQRCLQAMDQDIDESVELCFLQSENGQADIPPASEPVLMDAGIMGLTALIEDQLLLALPFAPMHAPGSGNCRTIADEEIAGEPGETGRQHPFAALAALKTRAGGED